MKNVSKIFFLLATAVLVGCGNEKKEEEQENFTIGGQENTEATTESTTNTVQDTTSTNGDVVEVSLAANDQMQFDKNEIKVKAGQTIRLTLRHTGQMEENVMGHNFVLLEQGTNINEFGQAAAKAADNEYIPQNSDQIIAHTELIGGGETTTVEFQAPAAGTYDFICSFPGHYAIMQGRFVVE